MSEMVKGTSPRRSEEVGVRQVMAALFPFLTRAAALSQKFPAALLCSVHFLRDVGQAGR